MMDIKIKKKIFYISDGNDIIKTDILNIKIKTERLELSYE